MDVEGQTPRVSAWLSLFPPRADFPWNPATLSAIESRRASMSDLSIFDVLLLRGGIRNPDMFYPPANYDGLRKLLEAVEHSVYDGLKQDCLVYILLKWVGDGREVKMAEERCIPPQFVVLADAYWMLDTGNDLSKAVSILSDARLNRDYVSKILQALSLAPSSVRSGLIVRYVRTAKPPLVEPDDIDVYTLALAEASGASPESSGGGSLIDAWAYTRTFPEGSETRERLVRKVLAWCLTPNPRPTPLSQLIGFPLSAYERGLLHTFALKPPSNVNSHGSSAIRDLVCVRLVQEADWVGAIRMERQLSASIPAGPDRGSDAASAERKKMMDDILATLPPSERALLESEIGGVAMGISRPSQASSSTSPSLARKDKKSFGDLSMSWEEVPSPSPRASLGPSANGTPKSRLIKSGIRPRASLSAKQVQDQRLFGSTSLAESSLSTIRPEASPFSSVAARHSVVPLVGVSSNVPLTGPSNFVSGPTLTAFGGDRTAGIPGTSGLSTSLKTHAFGGSTTSTPSKWRSVDAPSLFEKSGSAKYTPNAFYKPPTTQVRSLFGAGATSLSTSTPLPTPLLSSQTTKYRLDGTEGEVEQEHEPEYDQRSRREDTNVSGDENEFITHDVTKYGDVDIDMDEGVPTRSPSFADARGTEGERSLEFSVFGEAGNWNGRTSAPGRGHDSKVDPTTSARHQELETKKRERVPPGAFHTEESTDEGGDAEHEGERMITLPPRRSMRAAQQRPSQYTASPSPPAARKSTRAKTHSRSTIGSGRKEVSGRESLAQSIPGSLLDEEDDEERMVKYDEKTEDDEDDKSPQEEGDVIAPLPSTQSSRLSKGRLSRAKSGSKPQEPKTPQRRSSRLSIASSVASLSPELSPPAKGTRAAARKSARASTASVAVAGTRSSARRKR